MSITYVKYFEKWFETYKEPKVRQVTIVRYLTYIKHLQNSTLGNLLLKNIKRKDVQRFFNDFGKTRQMQTVLDIHTAIKSSFVDAQLDGLIKVNPCERIELVSVEKSWSITKRKEIREGKKWLEIDEYKKTKMYLIGMLNLSFKQDEKTELVFKNNKNEVVSVLKPRIYVPQMMLMVIYVAMKTGARVSEILGITKDDIDFDRALLIIDKTWDYKYGEKLVPTKNLSSIRQIVVDDEFLKVMSIYFNWLKKYDVQLDSGAIFIKNNVRVHNSSFNEVLKKIFLSLNIEPVTIHKLRHTQATILIAEGISLQVIAKRLGHTDTSMIQRVYGHLLKSVEEKENQRILEVI